MSRVAVLFLLLVAIQYSCGQNSTCLSADGIQDIRLVDGTYGDFMGRVEIRFNGTWGTICDDFWSTNDADVVCRMMGFRGGACAVFRAGFGQGPPASPIWLTNARCNGEEDCLGECTFTGLDEPITSCTHQEDAGVVCLSAESTISPPEDLVLVNSTTSTLTFQFSAITRLPQGASTIRYRLSSTDESGVTRSSYYYPLRSQNRGLITRTLTNLRRDTEHSVQLRVDYRYSSFPRICSSYIIGTLSDKLIVRTNATARPSSIQVRLAGGSTTFMGRVEVRRNNGTWGTVCDDLFGTSDASVFCRALGFDRALCSPFFSRFGPGTGPIWLDNLNCPASAEIIEDCSHPGWGVHNCDHEDDAGVVCHPGEDYVDGVNKPNVTDVKGTSAVISWEDNTFPADNGVSFSYQILYRPVGRLFKSRRTVSRFLNQVTLTGLIVGETYEVTMRIQFRVSACIFSAAYGKESDAINFTTVYFPPEGPPTNFHVVVLNSTAVEVFWDAPLRNLQNGAILGYIVSVIPKGGTESQYDFPTNSTDFEVAIIIGGLAPSTKYSFSVIAYNRAGHSPRTIYLRATTYAEGAGPLITRFGINGDGLDRAIRYTYQRNVLIHCGTPHSDVQIDWYSPSGEKVGITNRNLREAHYNNGTTVLQIAAFRRLSICDAGVYTCVANDTNNRNSQRKNFILIIGSIPSRPNRLNPGRIMSNSIQVTWEHPSCTGGHIIIEYNIQYYESDTSFFNRVTQYARHINASLTNYTINNLEPDTTYDFRIQAVTSDFRTSSFSLTRTITTLPPAPSPPRDISVRIISITVIEVSWRPPAVPNGKIIRYTVYLIPLTSTTGDQTSRRKRQAVQSPDIISITFSGSVTSGNITLPSTDVTYTIQVTASIEDGDDINEGIASHDVMFSLPEPVLPVPQNLRQVASTNSSITLQWSLPPPPHLPVEDFLVSYSSLITWTTPKGKVIQFTETGSVRVAPGATGVLISTLTPGTEYSFTVVASAMQGLGQEVSIKGSTLGEANGRGRVAFLQLKFGPVDKCSSFQIGNTEERLAVVENALIQELNKQCQFCGLTPANIRNGTFSCDGLTDQVVYRGRIIGNNRYNSDDLVSLIQSWVASDTAVINAGLFHFKVDSTCSSSLDSLDSSDCAIIQSPITTEPPTKTGPPPAIASATTAGVTAIEAVTIVVGFLIILILVGVVILLSVLFFRKQKSNGTRFEGAVRFKNERAPKEEDTEPFANMGPADQESIVFDSASDSEKPPIM